MTEKENHFWMKIDDFALSKDEIRKKGLSEQEIFSIRCSNGSIHGPFILSELKSSLLKNPAWRNFAIRPLNKHYWVPLGEHPGFSQRQAVRKSLLQSINPQNENIYLNIKGQTSGPYSFKEVEEKVLKKELLPCDLINPDPSKQQWIRLFETQYFNAPKKLPEIPQNHLFERTVKTEKKNTPYHSKTDAIINLAQLEKKIKSHGIPLINDELESTSYSQKIKSSWSKSSLAIIGVALLTVVMAVSIFFVNQKTPQRKSAKIEKEPFFVNKAKRIKKKPRSIQAKPKKNTIASPSKKAESRKFFPIKSHSALPAESPPEEVYEEEFETPPEQSGSENEEEIETINTIESYNNKNRNPSSSSEDENEGLGEIHDYPENSKNSFFEEDIELVQEPNAPSENSYEQ